MSELSHTCGSEGYGACDDAVLQTNHTCAQKLRKRKTAENTGATSRLELAVAKGKKLYDKRHAIAERDAKRQMDRRNADAE